jgi:hypothetical protein
VMRRTVSGAAEPRMSAGGERKLAAAVFAGAIIIARASAVAYRMHTYNLSSRPRFALGPFSFENCCYRSLRVDRARLLVAAGARQPSKKLAQVVIGDERAASELAGDELAGANGAVNSVAAKVGRSADFVDRICEPAFAAGDLRFAFHEEASFRLPTQSDGQRKGLLPIRLRTKRRGPAKKRAKLAGQFSLLNRGARGSYDAFVFCDGMLAGRRQTVRQTDAPIRQHQAAPQPF